MKKLCACALFIVICGSLSGASDAQADDRFPSPRIVQTQNPAGAVLFWDATAWVERFAQHDTPPIQALKEMEYKALTIFIPRATSLAQSEHHLHMVVAYVRTGAISARYHAKSVEDIQNIFAIDADLHPHMKFAPGWQSRARRGVLPAGVKLAVSSGLPSEASP